MERKIVANVSCIVFALLSSSFTITKTPMYGGPQANLHLDILMGRDELIEPSDVFLGDVSRSIIV